MVNTSRRFTCVWSSVLLAGRRRLWLRVGFPVVSVASRVRVPPRDKTCLNVTEIAAMIDLPLFAADLTVATLLQGCEQAASHGLSAIYCRSHHVRTAARSLAGSGVVTGTVVDWATSRASTDAKVAEAGQVLGDGAREVTVIIRTERIQDADRHEDVRREIAALVAACDAAGGALKVLFHTPELTIDEITRACRLAEDAGATIIQGGAWYTRGAASLPELRVMRQAVSPGVRLKVAAGLVKLDLLLRHYAAGADRFNTADFLPVLAEADHRVVTNGAIEVPPDDAQVPSYGSALLRS